MSTRSRQAGDGGSKKSKDQQPHRGNAYSTFATGASAKKGSGYDPEDPFSIPKCMELLNAMEIEALALYYRATHMLLDRGIRQAFMTMPPEKRLGFILASM